MKSSSRRSRVVVITIMVLLPIVVLTFLASADTTRAEPADVLELGFNEEFDSPTLDPAWHVVEFTGTRSYNYTSPANHFSLSDSPGHLRYYLDPMTHGEGFLNNYQTTYDYYYYDPGLELHREFDGQNWIIEGKADYFMPYTNGRGFHVRIYFGDGNANTYSISLTRGRDLSHWNVYGAYFGHKTGPELADIITLEAAWHHYDGNGPDLNTVYFRVMREGGLITVMWKVDGTTWETIFSRDMGTELDGLQQRVVITGLSWFDAGNSYADYDYIRLTPTPTQATNPSVVYVSSNTSGTAGGVAFADEDVLAHDLQTGLWYMVLDGSDLGLADADVDAFSVQPDGSLLLSLDNPLVVGNLGLVDDSDIMIFYPDSLGATTAGTFELFWDGSAYGLTTDSEDVDALAFAPDGRLLVSTIGNLSAGGLTAQDEDLSALEPSTGVWQVYFDGADVGLAEANSEDVSGVAVNGATGDIYLTTLGLFDAPGVSGDGADIFACAPGSLGSTTSCAYTLFWDGSAHGFGGESMDALEVGFRRAPMLWASTQTQLAVGGLTFNDDDIFAYDPELGVYAMVFDGSDIGITGDVDAFLRLAEGSLLLSLDTAADIPGLGLVDDSDILIFTPTALGQATAGTLAMFLDGSAYDLETDEEDIDALTFAPDGRLVVSTLGKLTVNNLTAQDEDLSVLDRDTGAWTLYFDGSDVALSQAASEDVNGVWVNGDASQVYLTTVGAFDVPGAVGDGSDILLCQAGSLGNTTSCTYSLYWDGSAHGVTSGLDGLALIMP